MPQCEIKGYRVYQVMVNSTGEMITNIEKVVKITLGGILSLVDLSIRPQTDVYIQTTCAASRDAWITHPKPVLTFELIDSLVPFPPTINTAPIFEETIESIVFTKKASEPASFEYILPSYVDYQYHQVSVSIDAKEASITLDGRTIRFDSEIPSGQHKITISLEDDFAAKSQYELTVYIEEEEAEEESESVAAFAGFLKKETPEYGKQNKTEQELPKDVIEEIEEEDLTPIGMEVQEFLPNGEISIFFSDLFYSYSNITRINDIA